VSPVGMSAGASGSVRGGTGEVSDLAGGQRPGCKPEVIAREAEAARRDFHRAAGSGDVTAGARPQGRSAALQAFFVANAGRGLMPSGETSGVLSPSLKTEEP